MTQVREWTVALEGMKFLEGPRWHDGRLFVSDFYRREVLALDSNGSVTRIASVPARPSGTGWLPDGDMLVVSQLDQHVLRVKADGTLVTHADLSDLVTGPANDMVVSATGFAYVGSMGANVLAGEAFVPAPMVEIAPDGSAAIASEPLSFPNGPAITDDQGTLIVAETMGSRISAFDVLDDGSLGPRRDWAVFGEARTPERLAGLPIVEVLALMGQPEAVTPDGIGLHRDGTLWVADAFNNRVIRDCCTDR